MTDWIDVEQKLPPDGLRVLIYCEYEVCCGAYWYGKWEIDPIHRKLLNFIGNIPFISRVSYVTHWMPLPELPKVNDDK